MLPGRPFERWPVVRLRFFDRATTSAWANNKGPPGWIISQSVRISARSVERANRRVERLPWTRFFSLTQTAPAVKSMSLIAHPQEFALPRPGVGRSRRQRVEPWMGGAFFDVGEELVHFGQRQVPRLPELLSLGRRQPGNLPLDLCPHLERRLFLGLRVA